MNNTDFKQKIYDTCMEVLQSKAAACKSSLHELATGIENDTKSSAGDKHETARALMQQEQEKILWQLKEINTELETLQKINVMAVNAKVNTGSLVKTDKGFLFLSIAIGRLSINGENIIALSTQSPLGLRLIGKTIGQSVEMNNNTYRILDIS